MQSPVSWPALLALAIPLIFGVSASLAGRGVRWRVAAVASNATVAAAAGVMAAVLSGVVRQAPFVPAPAVRLDLLTATMLMLVTCLGHVIFRFSRSYLAREPGDARYVRWLSATLAAVSLLVCSSSLLVIACAWAATSLALHQLLTFYRDRKVAHVAAHKKFIVSRMADLCLLLALVILHHDIGSLDLDVMEAWVAPRSSLPASAQLAGCLIALAAMLRSAQLPFHGWLMQVMEAPTPVSALLHAGVVNIGGFVLIRLSPFMRLAATAQLLLVVVGTLTAVIASLVATTRVSIKVALAWSTCAQMGFMMIECGLGAWHLALVHLLAHSVYKAHAFLDSGGTVKAWLRVAHARGRRPLSAHHVALSLGGLGAVALFLVVWVQGSKPSFVTDARFLPLGLVLPLAFAPLVARSVPAGIRGVAVTAMTGLGATCLYAFWHRVASFVLPDPADGSSLTTRWVVVLPALAALFVVQAVLEVRPSGRYASFLHSWLFAGLFLDETFTRWTFRIWPPRRRKAPTAVAPAGVRSAAGGVS